MEVYRLQVGRVDERTVRVKAQGPRENWVVLELDYSEAAKLVRALTEELALLRALALGPTA